MPHRSTIYYLQSSKDGQTVQIVGHSQDGETGEVYYKFLDRSKVVKLMKAEKKVAPEYQYRIIKQVTTYEEGNWE